MFFLFCFSYRPTLHLSLVRPSNNKLIWCGLTIYSGITFTWSGQQVQRMPTTPLTNEPTNVVQCHWYNSSYKLSVCVSVRWLSSSFAMGVATSCYLGQQCMYVIYMFMCVCVYVCMCVYTCMYVYMYVCMYACMYVCMYVMNVILCMTCYIWKFCFPFKFYFFAYVISHVN